MYPRFLWDRSTSCRPGAAAVAVLALLAACSSKHRSTVAPASPDARVIGSATFLDRDEDHRVGAGDTVTVRFDRPVTVTRAEPVPFRVAGSNDSLGDRAMMEAGDRADEVRIVLGRDAQLRAAGRFRGTDPDGPSALSLPGSDAIVDRETRRPVAADAPRDVVPGFAGRTIDVPVDGESIAAGDVDRDGDLDLVVGSSATVWVLRNDGHAGFGDSGQRLGRGSALALGDLDGDGDLDLVVGSADTTTVWRNDGAGTFAQGQSLPTTRTVSVAVGDLDGDGDLDLVCGNGQAESDSVWWNDGTGAFVVAAQLGDGNTHTVTLADVDGDGDLDLLQGRSGPSRIWVNDGAGAFGAGQTLGSGNVRGIASADLDCDGDLDLVTAGRDPAELWVNVGSGSFTSTGKLANAATDAVRLLDFDGDGRFEVYAANANSQDDELWTVGGDLVLGRSGTSFANGTTTDAAVGDFDRDGDLDVATIGPGEPIRVLISSLSSSRGPLAYVAGDEHLGEGPALQLAAGDIEHDGDLDIVETMGDIRASVVWRNDGTGTFPERFQLLFGSYDAAFGDVDRDGDVDLVETGPAAGVRLWRTSASGTPIGPTAVSPAGGVAVLLHDLDGDGDLDLVLARGSAGACQLLLNDGQGAFTEAVAPLMPIANRAAVADLDRDGDADLLFATDQGVLLLSNDGGGTFATATAIGTDPLATIAIGDVDGDGALDLAVGGSTGHAIWHDDGRGAFLLAPLTGAATRVLQLVDLDADGDLDLLRGGEGADELLRNDGGTFVPTTIALSAGPTNDFVIGDLDCDGDLDIVVADGSQAGGLRVYQRL